MGWLGINLVNLCCVKFIKLVLVRSKFSDIVENESDCGLKNTNREYGTTTICFCSKPFAVLIHKCRLLCPVSFNY
jgi:hypothetical protein